MSQHEDDDARLLREVHGLMGRLDSIDSLFAEQRASRDLSEKLSTAAADVAEQATAAVNETRRTLRTVIGVVMVGLLLWTPVMAYGAVWVHERVRNHCYPVAELVEGQPVDEPWYCSIFPGTGRGPHEHP